MYLSEQIGRIHIFMKGYGEGEMNIYRFESLSVFASFLKEAGVFPSSCTLYKDFDAYYLTVPASTENKDGLEYILREFASRIDSKLVNIFLPEHCKLVADSSQFELIEKCY